MLIPNVSCTIEHAGQTDLYGKQTLGSPKPSWCSVVKLSTSNEKTSVRADSSASRGAANEVISDARLLFKATEAIKMGDKVNVAGISLEVVDVQPRFDVRGRLDHVQVDLDVWA